MTKSERYTCERDKAFKRQLQAATDANERAQLRERAQRQYRNHLAYILAVESLEA